MENVTIAMDDRLVELTRAKAEEAGLSLADFISTIVAENVGAPVPADPATNAQLAALERIFAGPKFKISVDGKMPTSDERNARR